MTEDRSERSRQQKESKRVFVFDRERERERESERERERSGKCWGLKRLTLCETIETIAVKNALRVLC